MQTTTTWCDFRSKLLIVPGNGWLVSSATHSIVSTSAGRTGWLHVTTTVQTPWSRLSSASPLPSPQKADGLKIRRESKGSLSRYTTIFLGANGQHAASQGSLSL